MDIVSEVEQAISLRGKAQQQAFYELCGSVKYLECEGDQSLLLAVEERLHEMIHLLAEEHESNISGCVISICRRVSLSQLVVDKLVAMHRLQPSINTVELLSRVDQALWTDEIETLIEQRLGDKQLSFTAVQSLLCQASTLQRPETLAAIERGARDSGDEIFDIILEAMLHGPLMSQAKQAIKRVKKHRKPVNK